MTLAMVLTALLPMFTTAYYNLQGSTAAVSEGELRNLEQLARSTAGRLSQLASDSRNLARSLGTDADFPLLFGYPDDAAKEAILAKLDALVKANPDIHFIMVMDTEGLALVASDRQVMGKNFKFRDYFKAAMAGKPYVTGLVVGSVAGEAGMFYASPVFDRENKVVGAVVLRIRGSSFASILDEVREGSQRTPFLIDGDGVLVHHPDPRLLYSSLRKLPDDKMAAIRADQRFRRDRIESLDMPVLADAMVGAKSLGHVSYWSSVSRENEIAGYAPVKGLNWVVGVSESTATFQAPLNRLFDHLLWSVALVGLLFLGLALMFARSIVSPIRALTNAAHALKRGDYAHANLTVKRRDEIGQLARTFNVMIDVLRQRERERAGPRRGNNTTGRKSP
jgi:C4-dicarboxylate-specific signal transduction histidine kinase